MSDEFSDSDKLQHSKVCSTFKSSQSSRRISANCFPFGWNFNFTNRSYKFSNGGRIFRRRRSQFSSGNGSRHFFPRQPNSRAAFSSPSILFSSAEKNTALRAGNKIFCPPAQNIVQSRL